MITKHYCSKCDREFATYKECADHEENCKAFKIYAVRYVGSLAVKSYFSTKEKAESWMEKNRNEKLIDPFVVDEVIVDNEEEA